MNTNNGASGPAIKKYLECGKIVSTHGVRGEVKVQPWCDSPEYLCGFSTLYLDKGEKALEVEQARPHKNMAVIKLKGWDSIEEAVTLRGRILYIDREDDAGDGYFIQDLLGISVVDADTGERYGKLTDIISTGANDVYTVEGEDGKQRLVPAIPQVIIRLSPEEGVVEIRPLKGLFDDED